MAFDFAIDKSGNYVHVDNVPYGKECMCSCPECGEELIACNENAIVPSYFKHRNYSYCNASSKIGSFMSRHHEDLQRAIFKTKCIPKNNIFEFIKFPMLFQLSKCCEYLELRDVEKEYRVKHPERYKWVDVDVFAFCGKHALAIEVQYTHCTGYEKIELLRLFGISTLEIEINKRNLPTFDEIQKLKKAQNWKGVVDRYCREARYKIPFEWTNETYHRRFRTERKFKLPKPNISGEWSKHYR